MSPRQRFKSDSQTQLYFLTLLKSNSRSLSYQGWEVVSWSPCRSFAWATHLESSGAKTPASLSGTGNNLDEVRHVAAHMTLFPPQTSWQREAKKKEHIYLNKWQVSLSRDKYLVINLLSLVVIYLFSLCTLKSATKYYFAISPDFASTGKEKLLFA